MRPDDERRRVDPPRLVQAVNGPNPVDTAGRPAPTCTRAIRGPTPNRIPRDDALIRTPGATREPKPIAAFGRA